MLIIFILLFIGVFIYLLFIKNSYQNFTEPTTIPTLVDTIFEGTPYEEGLKLIDEPNYSSVQNFNTEIHDLFSQIFNVLST